MFGEGDIILVREDMKDINIWSGLWPIAKRKGEFTLRTTPYVLQLEENKTFIHIIEGQKTPIGYSSTLKKWIHMGTNKLKGLKALTTMSLCSKFYLFMYKKKTKRYPHA